MRRLSATAKRWWRTHEISILRERLKNHKVYGRVGGEQPTLENTTMASLLFKVPHSAENIEIGEALREGLKAHLDECLKGIPYYMTELLSDGKGITIMIQCLDTVFEDIKKEVENYFGMYCEFERFRPRELEG